MKLLWGSCLLGACHAVARKCSVSRDNIRRRPVSAGAISTRPISARPYPPGQGRAAASRFQGGIRKARRVRIRTPCRYHRSRRLHRLE